MRALLETLQQAIVNDNALPRNFLKAKPRLTPAEQVEIYAHAYKERLVGILEDDYPLARKQLGKRKFRELAKEFVTENPPMINDLAIYSREFGKSLQHKHNQLSAKVLKLIAIEAAEIELLELESLPPFRPSADTSEEQLLALKLIAQPASIMVGDQFHYRVGSQLFEQTLSKIEARALQQLAQASSLAEWAEQLPATSAAQIPVWLGKWLMHSMLCLQK